MYILDEVDAALDLSHTQNIGSLLRTRFKGSQFLVVSLKDGMFNNANVLFKTRFKDGTSVVERTTPYRKEVSRKRGRNDKENRPAIASTSTAATSWINKPESFLDMKSVYSGPGRAQIMAHSWGLWWWAKWILIACYYAQPKRQNFFWHLNSRLCVSPSFPVDILSNKNNNEEKQRKPSAYYAQQEADHLAIHV